MEEIYMDSEYIGTKTALLCTFSSKQRLVVVANKISGAFTIDMDRIFVLKETGKSPKDPYRYILTYNIIVGEDELTEPHHKRISNTIKINRNKETNCLYTRDALNFLIHERQEFEDQQVTIDWEEYSNSLLTYNRQTKSLVITETMIENIQNLEILERQ